MTSPPEREQLAGEPRTFVYVCLGPADEMEDCAYWQTAPGWCPFHPHIDLVRQDASATTIPPDHPGFGQ